MGDLGQWFSSLFAVRGVTPTHRVGQIVAAWADPRSCRPVNHGRAGRQGAPTHARRGRCALGPPAGAQGSSRARRAGAAPGRARATDRLEPHAASSPATCPAASDGQIEASAARAPRSARIASSRTASTSRTRRPRHASLQYRIDAQSRAHFLRHVMRRPHDAHGLAAGSVRAVLMTLVEESTHQHPVRRGLSLGPPVCHDEASR